MTDTSCGRVMYISEPVCPSPQHGIQRIRLEMYLGLGTWKLYVSCMYASEVSFAQTKETSGCSSRVDRFQAELLFIGTIGV